VERCQDIPETERAMPAAWDVGLPVPSVGMSAPQSMLNRILRDWAALTAPQSLVVLFDETDILSGDWTADNQGSLRLCLRAVQRSAVDSQLPV
jgi:hypothetical protein